MINNEQKKNSNKVNSIKKKVLIWQPDQKCVQLNKEERWRERTPFAFVFVASPFNQPIN